MENEAKYTLFTESVDVIKTKTAPTFPNAIEYMYPSTVNSIFKGNKIEYTLSKFRSNNIKISASLDYVNYMPSYDLKKALQMA